eukprot:TRINITY_DN35955_c0_g1_i1.p1 TRINITY_DN35955_c0_g1~~TRINITY_DN35955_c0_g1_i1.p1  ORF type:complete len:296 (-),score=36.63 TRINITY_DN35955_c0_g1_i1:186-1073(-)
MAALQKNSTRYWDRMAALQGGAETQCYESNEMPLVEAPEMPPVEAPDDTVLYDIGSTQAYIAGPIQDTTEISAEMPPPKSLPRKKMKTQAVITSAKEELEETQRYPCAALQTPASIQDEVCSVTTQGVASGTKNRASAASRVCRNHSILDVPDCDSEFENMPKPQRQKRPRSETASPKCSKPMKAAPRTPTRGKAAMECSSAEKRRSSAEKRTSGAENKKRSSLGASQLPAADKVLRYSGRPASSEYITQRCKSVDGRTIQYALEHYVTDHQGKPRIYRAADIRYDLSSGRLTVE